MTEVKSLLTESTLTQQCYEQLQNDIIEGTLKPGQKLKVAAIKQKLSIGQSPIREALSRLVANGLVDTEDHKGFRVSQMSEMSIRDIYETFSRVENMALSLAIERGDSLWEANVLAAFHILTLVENSNTTDIPYSIWSERNYNFHVALISACGSPELLRIRRTLYMKFDRYCRMAYQIIGKQLSDNYEDHQKLVHATLQRDTPKAQQLMTHHIIGALEDIIRKFKDNQLI